MMFWCSVGLMCDEFWQITTLALLAAICMILAIGNLRLSKRISRLERKK